MEKDIMTKPHYDYRAIFFSAIEDDCGNKTWARYSDSKSISLNNYILNMNQLLAIISHWMEHHNYDGFSIVFYDDNKIEHNMVGGKVIPIA
jgi:hypothetical protein